jgi:Amidase
MLRREYPLLPKTSGVSCRQFVLAAAVASSASGCRQRTPDKAATSAGLLEMSAVDAVAATKSGSLAAERYALVLLEQCERGKASNAFITLDRERVLAAARAADQRRRTGAELGPLHGLPIPIKENVNTTDTHWPRHLADDWCTGGTGTQPYQRTDPGWREGRERPKREIRAQARADAAPD